MLGETMSKQWELNLKKLDAEFELIRKLLEWWKTAIKSKIEGIYDILIKENQWLINGFK